MENNISKRNFIKDCNEIINDEEGIYHNDVLFASKCLLDNIFSMFEKGNGKYFDNVAFEIVTQEELLKIMEEGVPEVFKYYGDLSNKTTYINLVRRRSGLQFLFDYAEDYNVNKDVKARLKKILINDIIEKRTKELIKLNNIYNFSTYFIENNIVIPTSHSWWKYYGLKF